MDTYVCTYGIVQTHDSGKVKNQAFANLQHFDE